jgi:DNA-binding MarR family transcriptional regulator
MPSEPRTPEDLTGVYRRYLAAIIGFHLAAADEVGLGATDYQASNVLELDGPLTSGELAARLGLSTGATTRVIDRLVASGYARRFADDSDRRRVLVAHTERVPERLAEVLGLVRDPIGEVISSLTPDQLDGLAAYLAGAGEVYRRAAIELRGGRR